MTSARTEAAPDSPGGSSDPATSGRRKVIFAVLALVVGGAALIALNFKTWILWPHWVNGADKREYSERITAEQDPAIVPFLVAGFRDGDKADATRVTLGNLLVGKKNRAAEVEAALRDPSLDVRRLALMVLAPRDYFSSQYLEDPAYGVEKTLLEWLKDSKAKSRSAGIEIVPRVWGPTNVTPEVIRVLVDLLNTPSGGGDDTEAARLRWNAAMKLQAYKDCASAASILAAAKFEPNAYARMVEMQQVVQLFDSTEGKCAKEIPEGEIEALVVSCFEHAGTTSEDRAQRMAAMQAFERHPAWARTSVEAMRRLLAADSTPANEVERRTVLDALVGVKDPPTLAGFARHFHDVYAGVRSSAVQSVIYSKGGLDAQNFESCLVGFLRREPATASNQSYALRSALQKLRMFAPEWLGFPARARPLGPSPSVEIDEVMKKIFADKEIGGITRATVSDAWWDWLAKKNGLDTDEAVAAGKRVRDAFWQKADAGDAAAAKAVLDAAPAKDSPLWGYERGWLLGHP